MSFVTTHPEAMAATATNLQAIDSSMTAQNAAAAAPTIGIAPAGADEVSVLQATQFAAYGQLYQQISAQAAAIQEMFVNTLRTSADSYGSTEMANSAAAGLGTATGLGAAGSGSVAADPTFGLGGIASNSAILAAMQGGTIGSAASEFTGLGKGYITAPSGVVHHVAPEPPAPSAGLASQTAPAAAAAPISAANAGRAPVPGAPVPPNWAGEAAPAQAAPAALSGTGTTAATRGASTAAVPAGVPASSSDQGSRGRLRYGVKPKVMPRPTVG